MTTQSVTNAIYAVVTNSTVTTVEFPTGTFTTYAAVLSNIADDRVIEPFFHCDVHCLEVPRLFGAATHSVDLTINIYNPSQISTGSQLPMILVDQIIAAIRENIPVYEMGNGVLSQLGYTDGGEHFQYQYVLTFTTIY